MPRPKILVIGSINRDLVVRGPKLPAPGETVLGGSFATHPGGKGANQAVAAARLGADVTFIGAVGQDDYGRQMLDVLAEEGLNTDLIACHREVPTGVGVIAVDERTGENAIFVASGANLTVAPDYHGNWVRAVEAADRLILQLEIPLPSVQAALAMAVSLGKPVVLNAAPAQRLPTGFLNGVATLVVNEGEAAQLTGSPADVGLSDLLAGLHALGPAQVVITLGARGAVASEGQGMASVPAPAVSEAVDTTGAGDCFVGALAVALSEGKSLAEACEFAVRAASLSVTRHGAIPSLPFRGDL